MSYEEKRALVLAFIAEDANLLRLLHAAISRSLSAAPEVELDTIIQGLGIDQ